MDNRVIDLNGRRMRHAPWTVDSQGLYQSPSPEEITETYGISGVAVRETLIYFEQCRGSLEKLAALLNGHAPGTDYSVARASLMDEDRWYTNEYYFYLVMFCKDLIGRFDWHFGEFSTIQLSGHHRIWEKGSLRFVPYAGPDKDSTFSMIKAMLDNYTARGVDFTDLYEWADRLCREKTGISFKDEVLHIKNIWLSSEFWYYLIEFIKIITNINNPARIVSESFDFYELEGFSFAPEGMLLHVLTYMLNKSTRAYRVRADYDGGSSATFRLTRRADWNVDKCDKYFISTTRNGDEAVIAAYRLIIMKFFRLDVVPELTAVSGIGSGMVIFTINWPRRVLPVPVIPMLLTSTVIFLVACYSGIQRSGWLLSGVAGVNMIMVFYRYVKYAHNRIHILKKQLTRTITANEAKIEQAEKITRDLLEEKKRLLAEKRETVRRLKITQVYTRKSLVDIISAGEDPTRFPSTYRTVAVLFSDIRDFTRWSENRPSLEIVNMLNGYFNEMNRHISHENGEIDKLVGDGLMAVFTDADQCLRAAVRMSGSLRFLNRQAQREGASFFTSGIGINYGQVVVGNIGSESKMDYTVIGDIVNAASRLESLTRHYRTDIIISESFRRQLAGRYHIQLLDIVQVKGRQAPTRIYEVYDHLDGDTIAGKQEIAPELEAAFDSYQRGDFTRALAIYSAVQSKTATWGKRGLPLLTTLSFYSDRCRNLLKLQQAGRLKGWQGVYDFTLK